MSESAPPPSPVLDPAQHPTLSIEEVAPLLGVSRATAYEYARQGVIPVLRLSPRKFRVPTERFMREVLGMVTNSGSSATAPSGPSLDGAR